MEHWDFQALEAFDRTALEELGKFLGEVDNQAYARAAELIVRPRSGATVFTSPALESRGMFQNTALRCISSTGTPTYFLHGTEAVHGSCGQLVPGDVVIAISNSGETAELKATVTAIRNNGCAVIAVTGGMNSWLASQAEVTLYAGVAQEGDR